MAVIIVDKPQGKPRDWADYDPDTGTFLDNNTGQRVNPDGTPAADPFDQAVASGAIPSEAPLGRSPLADPAGDVLGPLVRKAAETPRGRQAVENYLQGAEPLRERVFNPAGEIIDTAMGVANVAARTAFGRDFTAPARLIKRTQEIGARPAAREAYDTESIPLVTGALDPRNLALGGEGLVAKGIVSAGRAGAGAAGRAAVRAGGAALKAGEAVRPMARELATSERGSLRISDLNDEMGRLADALDQETSDAGKEIILNEMGKLQDVIDSAGMRESIVGTAGQDIPTAQDIAGMRAETQANPLAKYLSLIPTGKMPETLSNATFYRLRYGAKTKVPLTIPKGRLPYDRVIDEAASELGMGTDEFVKNLEALWRTRREIANMETLAKMGGTRIAPEEAAQVGQGQAGMGLGEQPAQGGLFENLSPEGGRLPLAKPESLAAQEEARRLKALGQQEFPAPEAPTVQAGRKGAEGRGGTIGELLAGRRSIQFATMSDGGEVLTLSFTPDTSAVGTYGITARNKAGRSQSYRFQFGGGEKVEEAIAWFQSYLDTDIKPGEPRYVVKGKESVVPRTRPEVTPSIQGDIQQQITAIKTKRFKTANDEIQLERLGRQLKVDPSKWQVGQGVGWKAVRGQVNRGYRIEEVIPETREAILRPVGDIGQLADYTGEPVRAELVDLIRDRKYDSVIARVMPPRGTAPEAPAGAAARSAEPPVTPVQGMRYRAFDNPADALGSDVSSSRTPFSYGGAYEMEFKSHGVQTQLPGKPTGDVRGPVTDPNLVTRIFVEPDYWAAGTRAQRLAQDIPALRKRFPNAEFIEVRRPSDDPDVPVIVGKLAEPPVAAGAERSLISEPSGTLTAREQRVQAIRDRLTEESRAGVGEIRQQREEALGLIDEAQAKRAAEAAGRAEPKPTADGKGFEYSVPTSLVREGVVPGDMLTVPQFYPEQRHLIDLIRSSDAFTSLEPVETTIERLTRTARWDENDVVDSVFAMKKLGERGDLKAIADFNNIMRDKGRATGRNVQAWAAMAKMSPEGNFQDALNVLAEVLGKPVKGTQKTIGKAATGLPGKAAEVAKKQGDDLIAEAERLTAEGKADVAATRARAAKAAKAEKDPASAVAPPKTPVAALNRLDRAVQYLENEGRAPGMPKHPDELMAQLARTKRLAQETGWLMEHPEAKVWLDQVEAVWKLPAGERNAAARNLIRELVDTHLPTMEARSIAWKEASANLDRIDKTVFFFRNQGRAPAMRKVVNDAVATFAKAKRLAQQTGWIMNDPTAALWLDDAARIVSMGVGQAQVDATKAFIASTRHTLIPHLESLKKTQAELLREARYKEIMTGKLIPEAKQRAVNLARDAQNRSQQIVLKNGLGLDPDVAAMFWERSQQIAMLPPGMQQNREYARFMVDVKNFIPPSKWNLALDLYGLPVGLKTMWDAGWLARQGALLGTRHPGLWVDQLKSMRKLWTDPVFAAAKQDQLATRPLANLVNEMGGIFDEIWSTNEFFASKLGNKVPGMRGSQRTFVVPGNELRLRGIDQEVMNWLTKPDGKAWDFAVDGPVNSIADLTRITGKTEQEAKDMAMLYNAASGKSNIEWLRRQTGFLRLPFFAPGWALSLPEAVLRSTVMGTAKGTGAGILAKYFGSVAAILATGDLAGIWDAELDPRSSNFGKVRWKGTQSYTDPTLGLAAWLRLVAQIVPTPTEKGWGQWHKTAAGKFVPQDTGDIFLNHFLRGKTHPIPGELWSWATGRNIVGEKRTFTGLNAETALSVFNTAKSLFAPLTPVDIIEGIINDGLIGGVIGAMNIPGLNASSYTTFGDQQQKVTDELFPGKQYRGLPKGDQNKVNDSAEIKAAIAKFDEGPGVKLSDKVTVLYDTLEQGKHNVEYGVPATATEPAKPGLKDYIDAGMLPGKALKEKIQASRKTLYDLSSNMLTPEVLAYSATNEDKPLIDVYALKWLTVPLDENLETGELNFRKRDLERQQILLEAQDALKAAGKTSAYITERGEGSYRRKQFTDSKVQAMVDRYDADVEMLRPYWEARDKMLEQYPGYAKIVAQEKGLADAGKTTTNSQLMKDIHASTVWKQWEAGIKYRQGKMRRDSKSGVTEAGKKWGYLGAWTDALEKDWQGLR